MVQNARCPTDIPFPLNWLLTLKACVCCIFPLWVHQMSFKSFYERVFHYVLYVLASHRAGDRRIHHHQVGHKALWCFWHGTRLPLFFGIMLYRRPGLGEHLAENLIAFLGDEILNTMVAGCGVASVYWGVWSIDCSKRILSQHPLHYNHLHAQTGRGKNDKV